MDEPIITLRNIPLLLLSQHVDKKHKVKCLLSAVLPIDLSGIDDGYSYWQSDMILMPRKKYVSRMKNGGKYGGWEYPDILSASDWPNTKNWQALKTNDKS